MCNVGDTDGFRNVTNADPCCVQSSLGQFVILGFRHGVYNVCDFFLGVYTA